jgi:predicted nucleic acid-binding protein
VLVADTGAVLALFDRREPNHAAVREIFDVNTGAWLLPWAILPEVDYLVATRLGARAQQLWLADLADGSLAVEWGRENDLAGAHALIQRYASLEMGLVDAVVMVTAERLEADIATLDLRHFGAVTLKHAPRLLPRDATGAKTRPRRR